MINFDDYANENKTKHNPKYPYILDHPYRMLKQEVQDLEKQMHY